MNNSPFLLLSKQRFLPLFLAQFLGAFNDNAYKNALVILITYHLTTAMNTELLVTAAAGIFILPFFLFSATAGQMADKYQKSKLIFWVKFIEIILAVLAALGLYLENIGLLLSALFLLGTQASFFGPLKYSILPEQLTENELLAGNALIEAGTFLAILLGTIWGGLFILFPKGKLIISLSLMIVALLGLLSCYFIAATQNLNSSIKINFNFLSETWYIMRYSFKQKNICLPIIAISWFWLLGGTFVAEFPVFTKDFLSGDQEVVSFFYVLFSIGIALGSLVSNKLLKGKIDTRYVPWSGFVISLFILDLFLAVHFKPATGEIIHLKSFLLSWYNWRIIVDILFIAMSGGVYTVPLYALLQQCSDPNYRARVIASNNIMNALFMTVASMLTFGLLKYGFDVNQVFLIIAAANALLAFYMRNIATSAQD